MYRGTVSRYRPRLAGRHGRGPSLRWQSRQNLPHRRKTHARSMESVLKSFCAKNLKLCLPSRCQQIMLAL